ncbi:MAG: hypothetical protein BGP06_00520 [Rhizobiales bacterium 65-9]|nr:DUF2628 domain-containing protein [Hyphomicrobiales bacterium]OJY37256.1 MAG: hypothetical protein BGP06_00520 [Rhizobiales bacterium 65-9]
MSSWTVHLPPGDDLDITDTERFVAVKDGLRPFVILFGPLWFLWKRLWLGFFGVVLLQGALALIEWRLNAPPTVNALLQALLNILLALEAPTIQRWTLTRRRWREVGAVVAANRADAEMRAAVLIAELGPASAPAGRPVQPAAARPIAPPTPHVIGLFPEASPR